MKTAPRILNPVQGLVGLICMVVLIMSCSNTQPAKQAEASEASQDSLQESPAEAKSNETPDRSVFSGSYSALNEETGENFVLNVQVEEGKLILKFRAGGTEEYGYGEESIEGKSKGTEYLVSTTDLDGNGAISFLFKCTPEGKTTEVVATWLDDEEMKPMVMKPE